MVRVFIDDMIARRRGHIVAISSMMAFYPCGIAIAYTATKYAVKGFMEALTQEIRDEGFNIKTLTVYPHLVNSRKEMIDHARHLVGYYAESGHAPDSFANISIFLLSVRIFLKGLAFGRLEMLQ